RASPTLFPYTTLFRSGRNQGKLENVRRRLAEIDPACAELPLLSADVNDEASIRAVAESAQVVISTVGPYILYGEPLVAACAAAGDRKSTRLNSSHQII